MNLYEAIEIAIVAMDLHRQRFSVDANLFRIGQAEHGRKACERYDEINLAIAELTQLKERVGADYQVKMQL